MIDESPEHFLDVTVVIPTHDRADVLIHAIQSATEQEGSPTVFVVDDFGNATDSIIRAPDNVVYINRSNVSIKGPSASRNFGASRATTTWIAFLDDDDYWNHNFFALARKLLEKNPRASACVAWTARETPAGLRPSNQLPKDYHGESPRRYIEYGVTGSNLIVRRSAFEAIHGFDEYLWALEDLDFFARFLQAGFEFVLLPSIMVYQGGSSQSNHLSGKSKRAQESAWRYYLKYRSMMEMKQRRHILRIWHAMGIRNDVSLPWRVFHIIGMIACTTPSQWQIILSDRLNNRRPNLG